ncbi:L-asparaginase precursor [Seiridium cupressi]
MKYKIQSPKIKPRLIIHGGAGNINPDKMSPEKYAQYREALTAIVSRTNTYMTSLEASKTASYHPEATYSHALAVATYAVVLLENNPLFNSGHGAVFTRDGINELEASVMVSNGFAKRGVGVTGLQRVKNPILLARKMLEHGRGDLTGNGELGWEAKIDQGQDLDIPSAQGHTLIHGRSAEILAEKYELGMVDPSYYFTQTRWDEHVRALEREKTARQARGGSWITATWSADEYLPQGTCGAVALDSNGVVCCATSTGGMTNKLTGRIGDTPSIGAGFWAEEWDEAGDPSGSNRHLGKNQWAAWRHCLGGQGPIVELSSNLKGLLARCLPSPFMYQPLGQDRKLVTTRSAALSGTGNGDSFLRVAAVRTVVGIARWTGVTAAEALRRVAGRDGELQKSAGERWGKTGEGEGGMIGIEAVIVKDAASGEVVETRGEILQDFNCGGMFRAWIDEDGQPRMRIFDGVRDRDFIDEKH